MRRESIQPRAAVALSLFVALLIPLVTLIGLLVPGFYRDTAWSIPQERGQDLITLVVAEPLLIVAMLATRHGGGALWRLVWAGALGYTLYTYLLYSYTASFNALFLAYVALFSLAAFALASLLLHFDVLSLPESAGAGWAERAVAGFLLFLGVFFAFAWLGQIIPAALHGSVPSSITQARTPSNGVYVQDLGLLIPLLMLAGIWLWRGRAWGAALGIILLVMTDIMAAAIVAMALFMARAGIAGSAGTAAMFAVMTLVSLGFTALHARSLRSERARAHVHPTRLVIHHRRAG